MAELNWTRRHLLRSGASLAGGSTLIALTRRSCAERVSGTHWRQSREDPVLRLIKGTPDLDALRALFPPVTGRPAFEPSLIAENIKKLKPQPAIDTGNPFLDLSVKTGLAHIDTTFHGDHPKYGTGTYAGEEHDGFPPTIIAAVDALSAWGVTDRAATLFGYWLGRFVRDDGTIDYYGPSICEYGQLLYTAALLAERAGAGSWWADGFAALDRIAEYLLQLRRAAEAGDGLISGSPEADTRKDVGKYFHNNAWVAKGLRSWAAICERQKASPITTSATVRSIADALASDTLDAIVRTWPVDPTDWWLPAQIRTFERPSCLTGSTEASYTNYRYWPELLSSGLLPAPMAHRLVNARLSAGGQFCGMTRFADHLDDWPLADYLYGLWALGRRNDFLLSLYGHVAYHQAAEHLTAYEQVSFPPGKRVADYCLPCQLVAARAARWLARP